MPEGRCLVDTSPPVSCHPGPAHRLSHPPVHHLHLLPTPACPGSCSYCFGPRHTGPVMGLDSLDTVLEWLTTYPHHERLSITFHGGEPLLAGLDFFADALPRIAKELPHTKRRVSLQSNLWLLTDELAAVLAQHEVSIGTSIDGPEDIHDAQRGDGSFQRTMNGIELARRHGLRPACISTFTAQSAARANEVFDFFLDEGLDFSVHAAVPGLPSTETQSWQLGPEDYGTLLVQLFQRYTANLDRMRMSSFDALCHGISAGRGGVCTHGECLGDHLAVDPRGGIFPCQRLVGNPAYLMGLATEQPTLRTLLSSPIARLFAERQARIHEACGDCANLPFCRGGCPYNALVAAGQRGEAGFGAELRDPCCPAYQRIFDHIVDRATDEVFTPTNLTATVEGDHKARGLLQRGELLSLMRGDAHPRRGADNARRILSAVALGAAPGIEEATARLMQVGVFRNPRVAARMLRPLHQRLTAPRPRLNNLYLHLTFRCQLRCEHCYARAGERSPQDDLELTTLQASCIDAERMGFRHVVITGGEPLMHSRPQGLLEALAALRRRMDRTQIVLRSNLMWDALPGRRGLSLLSSAAHQIVVSVDGDQATHDARRGAGSHARTVANLRALVGHGCDAELSLAAALPHAQSQGPEGAAVRALARELGIRRVRFRPLLPLGRAAQAELELLPESLWSHMTADELLTRGIGPAASCGLGENLYVEPDGRAYPCYAWHGPQSEIGRLDSEGGLERIIRSPGYRRLAMHTVDTRAGCRVCALRYLCGGSCRAWDRTRRDEQTELDAAPRSCTALHDRARALLDSALGRLDIDPSAWDDAGLPLPTGPPTGAEP